MSVCVLRDFVHGVVPVEEYILYVCLRPQGLCPWRGACRRVHPVCLSASSGTLSTAWCLSRSTSCMSVCVLRDFVHGVVPVEEYILGRECFWRIVRKHIVENRRPPNGESFLPYFVAAKGGKSQWAMKGRRVPNVLRSVEVRVTRSFDPSKWDES